MKTIALLGPTGMLGSAVYGVLQSKYQLVLVLRERKNLTLLNDTYGGVDKHRSVVFDSDAVLREYSEGFAAKVAPPTWKKLLEDIGQVDGVVNCIGVTNRYSQQQPLAAYFMNSAFPHLLAAAYGPKLLHITTDCVYNGNEGAPYTEESTPSPTDLYGLTKMLGEPADRSLVLRTSIIGPEIAGFVSLLEWVRKQDGKTIKGFTKHHWNGITTKEYGNIADKIFADRSSFPDHGLFHVFSSDVTKYDMVIAIAKKYHINATITPDGAQFLDRRLRTVKDLNERLHIPAFQDLLNDLSP